jgi:dTDP-4-dehydrorhamnose 3,5-epimerase
MKASRTKIDGVILLETDPIEDDRGYFARIWDDEEFRALGMTAAWRQANVGHSTRAGTLRGMHLQHPPAAEWKLVRCTRGAIYDVAVDLRAGSSTRADWIAAELTAENGRMLLIPEGCAHGYMTLRDASEMIYLTSSPYEATSADGVRWDDPRFGIKWPMPPVTMSPQDASWPDWHPSDEGGES